MPVPDRPKTLRPPLLAAGLLLCCAVFLTPRCAAQEAPRAGYSRLTELPGHLLSDYKIYADETFRRENIPPALGLAAATGVMIYYDKELIDGAQKLGRRLGLGNKDNTKPYIKAWRLPLFRGPSDTGSALYFLGDGWVHFSISGGFYAYGYLADSPRAVRTGYALLEGIGATAVATQVLKRSTGRESPFVATSKTGKWRFFPNQNKYSKYVSHYDAFPSGHLATAMMTVTVISNCYPEYPAIAPVGYSIMSLLAFQMMNNGVHWISDYPLALSLGYSFGKIAARRARGETGGGKKAAPGAGSVMLLPDFGGDRTGVLLVARL